MSQVETGKITYVQLPHCGRLSPDLRAITHTTEKVSAVIAQLTLTFVNAELDRSYTTKAGKPYNLGVVMRRIPRATYQTPDEVLSIIAKRKAEADALVPGPARQSILVEIAKLQAYADMKRWVATPSSEKKNEHP